MSAPTNKRAVCTLLAIYLRVVATNGYSIPEVTVSALAPKGFRASIPDAPNLGLFAFHGHVNRAIASNDVGTISGEVTQPTNGRWVYENQNIQLKPGDVVNYYVFVSQDSVGYVKDNLTFTVHALEEKSSDDSSDCLPTATRVRGGTACAGHTIFEDHFDSLRDEHWQIEQYIPLNHPEFPFVSYQHLPSTVSVRGGHLRIAPVLQQNLPGFNNDSIYFGTLDLYAGCTGTARECSEEATGALILPPVVSGKVTSRTHFTYGTVHVRAKLPRGDWIYPDLLLEPVLMKYGKVNYMSGVMKIAASRGNARLLNGNQDIGNKLLYGGPIIDRQCREQLIQKRELSGNLWSDDFHLYSIKWTPESIELLVDNELWARIAPPDSLTSLFTRQCPGMIRKLPAGSKMAPFDDHFYLTLGLSAGGITEFPDGSFTQGTHQKPWRNQAQKAVLHFWEDSESWLPTWSNSELLVDYVKIVAL